MAERADVSEARQLFFNCFVVLSLTYIFVLSHSKTTLQLLSRISVRLFQHLFISLASTFDMCSTKFSVRRIYPITPQVHLIAICSINHWINVQFTQCASTCKFFQPKNPTGHHIDLGLLQQRMQQQCAYLWARLFAMEIVNNNRHHKQSSGGQPSWTMHNAFLVYLEFAHAESVKVTTN